MASSTDRPPQCQRCRGISTTRFYRHPYEGGFHIGLHCTSCRDHAQTGRTWYPHTAFTRDEIAQLPELAALHAPDPRQRELF